MKQSKKGKPAHFNRKPRSDQIQLPKPEKPKRIKQNGYTRPNPTNAKGKPKITFQVWRIADELSAVNAAKAKAQSQKTRKKVVAKPPTRQEIIAACTAEKIPLSVIVNQFYRWRKFNGVFLRVKKDGTLSKPMGRTGPRKKLKAAKAAAKPRLAALKKKPKVKAPTKAKKPVKSGKPAVAVSFKVVSEPNAQTGDVAIVPSVESAAV